MSGDPEFIHKCDLIIHTPKDRIKLALKHTQRKVFRFVVNYSQIIFIRAFL